MARMKPLFCLAAFVLIAATLVGCTPTVEELAPPVESVVTASVRPVDTGVPEYGGNLGILVGQTGGFSPAVALNLTPSVPIVYESLVAEDWARGPSGANETPFASNYTPPEYYTGWLARSWEVVDPRTIIYRLRPGVRFQKKPPVNGRELTAADVVFSLNYYKATAGSGWYTTQPPERQLTAVAIDNYTVKFTLPDPNPYMLLVGYNNFFIIPRELLDTNVDLNDWRNMNTTGPFSVVDVVENSSVIYERNPSYWQVDPFRPTNHLPYVNRVVAVVVPDLNLMMAAFNAGRVERLTVTKEQAASLQRTNPDLRSRRLSPSLTNIIHMRTDVKTGPFANVLVRQALSMAIDRDAIIRDYFLGDAVKLNWPFQPATGAVYTPLEELPANLREIYEYNPQRAKELLAAAGYPNGFKTTLNITPGYAGGEQLYAMVKTYFDAVGVQTNLNIRDAASYWPPVFRRSYDGMSISAWGNGHPNGAVAANTAGYVYNYSAVNDPFVDSERLEINAAGSDDERNARLRDLGLYLIEQQYYIEVPSPYSYVLWHPWLRGQNGEVIHGSLNNGHGYTKFVWIDQALKTQSTGRKE